MTIRFIDCTAESTPPADTTSEFYDFMDETEATLEDIYSMLIVLSMRFGGCANANH